METLDRIPVSSNAPTFAVEAVRVGRPVGHILGKGPIRSLVTLDEK